MASAIYVLAGVNGAGKSSLGGAMFRESGADYYNPDELARLLRSRKPNLGQAAANEFAWKNGVALLEQAIARRLYFALESTLGGQTIPGLLEQAIAEKIAVRIWYIGLTNVELHIERVRARVRQGGHDIPGADIRRRFERSRINLIELMAGLTALRVYDNSENADPASGSLPHPKLVLSMEDRRIVAPKDIRRTPEWAKPIVAAALRIAR